MDALKKALELAEPQPDREALLGQIAAIGREIDALETKKNGLLPIEAEASVAVSSKIAALKEHRRSLRRQARKPCPYRKLSLAPLEWRNEKGYPRLVLFRPDRPAFTLKQEEDVGPLAAGLLSFLSLFLLVGYLPAFVSVSDAETLSPPGWQSRIAGVAAFTGMLILGAITLVCGCFAINGIIQHRKRLPKRLQACYADVIPRLRRSDEAVQRITTSFAGVIPPKTRERIRKAGKEFKQVLILAEPDPNNWQVVRADPLVVGWDGKSLWLVDSFDTTPTEEYVNREFTF